MIFSIFGHLNYPFSIGGRTFVWFADLAVRCQNSKPYSKINRYHFRKKIVDFLLALGSRGNFIGKNLKLKALFRQLNTSFLPYLPSARMLLARVRFHDSKVSHSLEIQMIKCRSLSEESSLDSLLIGGSARLNLSVKDSFRDSRRNKLLLYAAIGGGARDFLGCSTGKYALVKFMDFFSNRVFSPVLISRVPELRGMKSESSDGILVKSNYPVLFSTDSTSKFGFHKTTKLKGIARA